LQGSAKNRHDLSKENANAETPYRSGVQDKTEGNEAAKITFRPGDDPTRRGNANAMMFPKFFLS
jgi:hypothetical protein